MKFITGSKDKLKEFQAAIPDIKQLDVDLDEIQDTDPKRVIEHKLNEGASKIEGDFLCEDTSLEIYAMNGFPGTFIKWFAKALEYQHFYDICKEKENYKATARTIIGLRYKNQNYFLEGITTGTITTPKGKGYGFDCIFVPDEDKVRYSEMSTQEKLAVSHRGKAIKKLQEFLTQN